MELDPVIRNDSRFGIQASRYEFPYHYLPTLDASGAVAIHRFLSWGLDYLTYMTFVVEVITQRLKAHTVLDIGCGDGRLISLLQGKVSRLVGVDPLRQAILFAQAFNPDAEFLIGDVSQVPGQFQVTALIEVLEHIPDEECPDFVAEVAAKTSPQGRLVVSVPTTNVPLSRKHYRHYDLGTLSQHLAPCFTIEHHWFVTKHGIRWRLWNRLLQNPMAIILPGFWRRMVWGLHRRHTFMADGGNGRHLVIVARPTQY